MLTAASDENGVCGSGIGIVDPPAEQEAEWKKFMASHPGDAQRAYFGRSRDRPVGLRLMHPQGHQRIRLQVKPDGWPVLELLDRAGSVIAQLLPATGTLPAK